MLRPRAYGKFGNITLIQFPSEEAPEPSKNLEMYNAFDIVLSRFRDRFRFLYYFCRDIIDYGMKADTKTKSFMDHYVDQKLLYGRTLPSELNDLLRILDFKDDSFDPFDPSAIPPKTSYDSYTEEMVDDFVDKWKDYMVKKFDEYYERFASFLDKLRQRGELIPELAEPYTLIAIMVSYGWNDSHTVKPDIETIKEMVMAHVTLVVKEIDEVEWYIREKFLTIQWAKDYRITSWVEANVKAKFQSEYEKMLVRLNKDTRYIARAKAQDAAEEYFYEQEDSDEFKFKDFQLSAGANISAHIFALMKKKCVIKDEKKKKKNIPRRKKVIKKEEEEGGFFF
jgi:hypothetical protein